MSSVEATDHIVSPLFHSSNSSPNREISYDHRVKYVSYTLFYDLEALILCFGTRHLSPISTRNSIKQEINPAVHLAVEARMLSPTSETYSSNFQVVAMTARCSVRWIASTVSERNLHKEVKDPKI